MEKLLATLLPGIGKEIHQSRRELLSACRKRSPVLIAGEPGTGKDHVAGIIHSLTAPAGAPFRKVDLADGAGSCRHLSRECGCSTIYLDHSERAAGRTKSLIREIASSMPAEGRIILSVNTPPSERGLPSHLLPHPAGDFSFIHLPPLRRRREDIPLLMSQMSRRFTKGLPLCLPPDDIEYLYSHDWPGNLGELWQWMEGRVVPQPGGMELSPDSPRHSLSKLLEREINAWVGAMIGEGSGATEILRKMTGRVEKCVIRAVLTRMEGNQVLSAALLGINRNTLAQKIRIHGLSAAARRKPTKNFRMEV